MSFAAGKEQKKAGAKVIGVVGTGRGVGVTHFCILLAEYLAIDRGSAVAVCECNTQGDLKSMQTQLMAEGGISFCFRQVHYFPSVDRETLAEICRDYHYLILDVGEQLSGKKEELGLCQRKILLAGESFWRLGVSQKKEAYFFREGFQCIYNLSERGFPFSPLDKSPAKKARRIFEDIVDF